jgi:hypothetical protein
VISSWSDSDLTLGLFMEKEKERLRRMPQALLAVWAL